MTAEFHIIALLFALPAGILSYFIFSMPDHPRLNLWHLPAVVLLFIIPLIGLPEVAGGTVLYYAAGFTLTRTVHRRRHQEQPSPDPPTPQPKRDSARTAGTRTPIIFKRQQDE